MSLSERPRGRTCGAWMGYGEGERGVATKATPGGALAARTAAAAAPSALHLGPRAVQQRPQQALETDRVPGRSSAARTRTRGAAHVTFENDDGGRERRATRSREARWRPVDAPPPPPPRQPGACERRDRRDRLGAAPARPAPPPPYVLLVRMIASTVDEFGPVETATTLKALASMQMYADNARATSPHQTLSRTSRRRKKKETTTEETNAADVDLAEGLARAVSRNAHRMHARLLALTLPALRLLPGVTKLIDAETYSTLASAARAAARSGALGAVETANVAYAMTRIPPLLRVANEPTNHAREGGRNGEAGADRASCAADRGAERGDGARTWVTDIWRALVGFDHPAAAAGRRRGGRRARSPARDAARGARGRGRARGALRCGPLSGRLYRRWKCGRMCAVDGWGSSRRSGGVCLSGGGRRRRGRDGGRRGRGRAGEGGRRRRVSATRAAAGGGRRGDWPTFITSFSTFAPSKSQQSYLDRRRRGRRR